MPGSESKGLSSEFIEQLQDFLVQRFDDAELRLLVRCTTNEEIAATLPGPQESLTSLATAAVSILRRHGYLEDKDFFQRLYQERPRFRSTIDHLFRLWISSQKSRPEAGTGPSPQPQFHVKITASGNLSDLNYSSLERLVAILRETTNDSSIVIEFVARGSVIIGLRCSKDAQDQICSLFSSGALPTLPEFDILGVDATAPYFPPAVLDVHNPEVALRICGILADNFPSADLREWLQRRHYAVYSSLLQSRKDEQWSAYEIVAQFQDLGIPAELIISSLLDECPSWIISRLSSPLQMSQRGKILLWKLVRIFTVCTMMMVSTYLTLTTVIKQSPPPWSGPSVIILSAVGAAACPLLYYIRLRRMAVVTITMIAVALGVAFWSTSGVLSACFWLGALPPSILLWNRPTLQRFQTMRSSANQADQSGIDFSQIGTDTLHSIMTKSRFSIDGE